MDVGRWQFLWMVVNILVGQLVSAATDREHLHTTYLQDQSLLTDTQALLSFKQKIEMDPEGILNEWNLQIHSNSCDWFGVTCANARVIALNLTGCRLVAALDPIAALAALGELQELHLAHNFFYSFDTDQVLPFPCDALISLDLSSNNLNSSFSNLQNCKSLAYLNISHNALHGPLSSSVLLGDTISLRWLDLSHNNFSGMLPSDIFLHCGTLSWLDLSSNSLSGSLPSGISQCVSLQHLHLSFNSFNGTLPTDVFPPSSNIPSSLISVQLSSNNISGHLPPIASCANLSRFDISDNLFTGNLPSSLGGCTSLRILNVSHNAFIGSLPTFITSLVNLEVLSMSENNFTGTVWPGIGDTLLALQELHLFGNELVGSIPSSLSNCTSIQLLNLGDNSLSGEFPVAVVNRMWALRILIMSFNFITGTLPSSLTNASSLAKLDLSANSFTGTIPGSICSPSLRGLWLADNELSGAVPLESCTNLVSIDVSCNFISSTFVKPFPVLPYMQELIMWGNLIAEEIPSDICSSVSQLWLLVLNLNLITGTIPPGLANCSHLEWLSLSGNLLTGSIPTELGLMPRINFLHLNNNSLSGTIPPSLGDCKFLVWVDLSSNQLEGPIPPELAKQSGKLQKGTLNMSLHFAFFKYLQGDPCTYYGLGSVLTMTGVRPERLYRLPSFRSCYRTRLYLDIVPYYIPIEGGSYTYLDVAHNRLSGTIPEELGTMTYLTVLSISYNNITGSIPFSLANLVQCSILHLDHNHLQGPIPPSLSKLGILNQLDFSSNNLSGSIPDSGKLPTFPESSFASNPYLCGTPLPACEVQAFVSGDSSQENTVARTQSSGKLSRTDAITIAISLFFALLLVMCECRRRRIWHKQPSSGTCEENVPSGLNDSWTIMSTEKPLSINIATFEKPLHKFSYQHLWETTNGFSKEAVIGQGGFGFVYKATFANGITVAIKKLAHPAVGQGNKEFTAEMETLGKLKHRNLVPLIGYCKMGDEMLLVYEYMEGGSLDKWLHNGSTQQQLNWDRRKRVAFGMARALCFLHNGCIPHIIHRDLKSGNVLLDDVLEARLSDFGMALLASAFDTHVSVSTLVGTPGYVPPEYCQSFRCTMQGDVYSFGVVLLELITGRSPTGSSSVQPQMATANGTTHTMRKSNDDDVAQRGQHEEGEEDLVRWVRRHITEGNARAVLDKQALHGSSPVMATIDLRSREKEMLAYLAIACRCVGEKPGERPSMKDVIAEFRELHRGQDLDLLQ